MNERLKFIRESRAGLYTWIGSGEAFGVSV
jgi:hypothetical protein